MDGGNRIEQSEVNQGSRLFAFTGGFFRQKRVARILQLAGYDLKFGWPRADDRVAVWGRKPRSRRGAWVAKHSGAGLMTVEDAFLRSVHSGRSGEAPQGLVLDQKGVYFDTSNPSELQDILNSDALGDPTLLTRAKAGIRRMHRLHISKYNAFDPTLPAHGKSYVLVIDQTRGDASIVFGGADATTFRTMLLAAKSENPGVEILIKTHPEVSAGFRTGHFGKQDEDQRTTLVDQPLSPWTLMQGATKVYCVTSLMGFEAILAGHRPQIFGRPFYAGRGLSDDQHDSVINQKPLSVAALFAGVMLLYPTWYDPYRDALCDFETVLDNLTAQSRAWREDQFGYAALGIRLWKRAHFSRFFAAKAARIRYPKSASKAVEIGRPGLIWAGQETPEVLSEFHKAGAGLSRLEDGFLRSTGLGAELVPPLSLVLDDLGIYYDPTRESRLERLVAAAAILPKSDLQRAQALWQTLRSSDLSKYNIGQAHAAVNWPQDRQKILVPGQVEDDASIRTGTAKIKTNLALLQKTRAENPDAFLVFKPHPDVEAGLRKGRLDRDTALQYADVVAENAHPAGLMKVCDAVWTMTSLLGFEALLRGLDVTCLGMPFYSGWGLTNDLGSPVPRRKARPSMAALVQAVLIEYPRYFDPETGMACPVEVTVERLRAGISTKTGVANRSLAKLQGLFASYSWMWR